MVAFEMGGVMEDSYGNLLQRIETVLNAYNIELVEHEYSLSIKPTDLQDLFPDEEDVGLTGTGSVVSHGIFPCFFYMGRLNRRIALLTNSFGKAVVKVKAETENVKIFKAIVGNGRLPLNLYFKLV